MMIEKTIALQKTLTDETFFLNMGPQHPATHGVLRLLLKLDGEYVRGCEPVIGYGHRGHEHMAQNRTYLQFMPNPSRMDYLSGLLYNDAYCRAVERMVGIQVPARAEYIRILCCELNRISSHLLWFGSYLMDLGGFTPFLYAFDDREDILSILGEATGSRLTYSYCCFGGVSRDLNDLFLQKLKAFIPKMRGRLKDYNTLVTKNIIFIKRTRGIGVITSDQARDYGLTGPNLRAGGMAYDMRKNEPYGFYPQFDFEIPVQPEGDCLARYQVRLEEISQSLRIIEQALQRLPDGSICAEKVPQYITPEPGDYHFSYESARGQVGIYIVSDGSRIPYRMKWRTPSFSNLSILPVLLPGTLVADTIAILGSLDVVIPEIDR
jgi:NADH-quinone oxidoreductase subunit D